MISRTDSLWLAVLAVTVLVRLFTLDAYPLADTTEARYAEIGRVMATTGNWITPQLSPGEPFWAKPPLSVWLTATSYKLFSVSAFTARIPSLFCLLFVAWLVYRFATNQYVTGVGLVASVITLTSVLGFVTAGAVMTDPALVVATTLAMVSFWYAVTGKHPVWAYLFFIAMAIRLLTKGPISGVLISLPLVLWTVWQRRYSQVRHSFPWIAGIALMSLLAIPWFLLAEIHSPGFLHYFIVGEHIQRFLDSGWSGDKYGSAHAKPRGMIWLYALVALFPWSVFAVLSLIARWRKRRKSAELSRRSPWNRLKNSAVVSLTEKQSYLLLWAITPLLFFTLAGNILPTYVLTGLPAFALLLAPSVHASAYRRTSAACALTIALLFGLGGPLGLYDRIEERSQSQLINHAITDFPDTPLVYFNHRPHSARFYSAGNAGIAGGVPELTATLDRFTDVSVIVKKRHVALLPSDVIERMRLVHSTTRFNLYHKLAGHTENDIKTSTRPMNSNHTDPSIIQ